MKPIYAIGLMSGTSMDGVDVALLKTDGEDYIESCAEAFLQYPQPFQHLLKAAEYATQKYSGDLNKASKYFDVCIHEYFHKKLQFDNKRRSS